MKRLPTPLERFAAPLLLLLITGVYAAAFVPLLDGHAHTLGGDYWEFLPRLVADYYWFTLNGWHSVPWFTPAFCGGFPNWPNPQMMPYSLPQLLVHLVDPVRALQLTLLIEGGLGVAGGWLLLRRGFNASRAAALLGATLFLFNGFFVARMAVGHLPMHSFMLAPLAGWLLVRPRRSAVEIALSGVLAGSLLALMLHGGAIVVLPPLGLAWIAIGVLHVRRGGSAGDFAVRFGLMLAVGTLLAASKLVAMSALLAQFPRDQYPLPGFATWGGLLSAVARSLFWRPDTTGEVVDSFYLVELHERDYGLSPVPVVILVATLILGRAGGTRSRRSTGLTMLLVFLLLIPLALNIHGEQWTWFLKQVPVIRSSSSLYRYLVVYVVVLPVLCGLALDRLPARTLWAVGGVVVAIGWSVTGDRHRFPGREYRAENMLKAWETVHSGGSVPSIGYMEVSLDQARQPSILIGGDDMFSIGVSNVFCYEPLLGYALENFPWRPLHTGPALDASDGVLNVKNPVCDLYPVENGCQRGDHFLASDRARAEDFLSWQPIPFVRPLRQRLADAINLGALLTLPVALAGLWMAARRRNSRATVR